MCRVRVKVEKRKVGAIFTERVPEDGDRINLTGKGLPGGAGAFRITDRHGHGDSICIATERVGGIIPGKMVLELT